MSVEQIPRISGNVLVVGASGGIGQAIALGLAAREEVGSVVCSTRGQALGFEHPKVSHIALDFDREESLAQAAAALASQPSLIVVATGMLHGPQIFPERALKELDAQAFSRLLFVNTVGPALLAKHFVPLLSKTSPSTLAFLGARVGSIADNRAGGWYSYRTSKAALVMFVKTLSIELRRTHPQACALCLHPGTVRSELSAPFVRPNSKRKTFSPEECAGKLLGVLDGVSPEQSGMHLDYAGIPIEG